MNAVVYDRDERLAQALLEILKRADGVDHGGYTTRWAELQQVLTGKPRSIVVLGPGVDEADLAKVPRTLSEHPGTAFVQVVETLDADSLKRAMRFGVRDVLAVADGGAELAEAVLRTAGFATTSAGVPATTPINGNVGRVVSVFGAKGGTGKSFLATNLAVLAARSGIRTALVDASVHFGDCASLLRVRPIHSVADLGEAAQVDESLLAGVMADHDSGIRILCAPYDPLAAEDLDPRVISHAAKALRRMFDLTIVDTGPALDGFTIAALDECDLALLVTSLEVPAVKDAKVCLAAFDRLGLNPAKARVILNRANSTVAFPLREVTKSLGFSPFAELPSDANAPRSMNEGIPVCLGHPKAKVSKALTKLYDEVLAQLGMASRTRPQRKSSFGLAKTRPAEAR